MEFWKCESVIGLLIKNVQNESFSSKKRKETSKHFEIISMKFQSQGSSLSIHRLRQNAQIGRT